MNRSVVRLVLLGIICVLPILAGAEHSPAEEKSSPESSPKSKQEDPTRSTIGYTPFARGFKEICNAAALDGRRELLGIQIGYALDDQDECRPCKAFLRSFAAACLVKVKKEEIKPTPDPEVNAEVTEQLEESVEAEGTPTPLPTATPVPVNLPPQREPCTQLIDAASQWFIKIAEDERRNRFALRTVRELTAIMREPEDKKPGEREYLDILAEYFLAPFRGLEARIAQEKQHHSAGGNIEFEASGASQKEVAVDDLFGH